MAQSSDVQYVAYLKAKFNLADADLLQVISLSQRSDYSPTQELANAPGGSDSPGFVGEEEKAEVDPMDQSYEEVIEEDEFDDEVIDYLDESYSEEEVSPDPSPTPAPAPAPMPLSNNDQMVAQSTAIVPVDNEDDDAVSTLKMPETVDPRAKTRLPADVTKSYVRVDEDDVPDDEKMAIVPAKSQSLVPVPEQAPPVEDDDEEKAVVVAAAPPITDVQDDDKTEENPTLYVVVCFILLILIAVAVLLILIFVTDTIPKWWEDDAVPIYMDPYEPGNCNFDGQAQPSVISQCECSNQVSVVEASVQDRYNFLAENFIAPTVYNSWSLPIESCEPTNQALLWLSTGPVISDELDLLQRYTMAFLYFSTQGEQWRNDGSWLSEANVCTWFGLVCADNELDRISLVVNRVDGQIPSELALLTRLESISLDDNRIQGQIPVELFIMPSMKTLTLGSNQLEGFLPTEIGRATGLEVLRLNSNLYRGAVPTEMNVLTSLKSLSLEDNQLLTGRIATEYGTFSNLESLSLSSTDIRARIPTEYGLLTKLQELKISNTLVGGNLPLEFAKMTDLKIIDFTGSRFRQTIPSFLGRLTDLTMLMLGNNEFEGVIPTTLGNLNLLQVLDLQGNELTGVLPVELGRLRLLQNLTINGNPYITGNVPTEICALRSAALDNFTSDCPTREFGILCPITTCCTSCVPLEGIPTADQPN